MLPRVSTVLGTCVVVGVAAGSSVAGPLVDAASPSAAFLLPAVGGLVGFVFAAVHALSHRRRLRLNP